MDNDDLKDITDTRIIENINNNTLFIFTIIIIVVVYYFSHFNINLNIIFGFVVSMMIIYYLYNDNNIIKKRNNELLNIKKSNIKPNLIQSIKYDNIVDFIFTIQDFYKYNPISYQLMISHIDYFFEIYETIQDNNESVYLKYDMLIAEKKNSINALHSIIFSLTPNTDYDNKLKNSMTKLDEILNIYIDNAKNIYENELYKKNITHKIISSIDDPEAYNSFLTNKSFSYDII
jgi:hypothetical protein